MEAVMVRSGQARRLTDGAVDICDGPARPADAVMVVVADPRFVAREGTGGAGPVAIDPRRSARAVRRIRSAGKRRAARNAPLRRPSPCPSADSLAPPRARRSVAGSRADRRCAAVAHNPPLRTYSEWDYLFWTQSIDPSPSPGLQNQPNSAQIRAWYPNSGSTRTRCCRRLSALNRVPPARRAPVVCLDRC